MGKTTDVISGIAYLTVSGHSYGGAGYLTRVLKALRDNPVHRVVVLVETGEYQEAVLAKIAEDLRLCEKVTGCCLNARLMRVNDHSMNDEYDWVNV